MHFNCALSKSHVNTFPLFCPFNSPLGPVANESLFMWLIIILNSEKKREQNQNKILLFGKFRGDAEEKRKKNKLVVFEWKCVSGQELVIRIKPFEILIEFGQTHMHHLTLTPSIWLLFLFPAERVITMICGIFYTWADISLPSQSLR